MCRALARPPLFAAPLLALLVLFLSHPALAAASPPDIAAPSQFTAKDRPGDSGGAILLTWKDPAGLDSTAVIQIRRTKPPAYEWTDLGTVKAGVERYEDTSAK